MDYGFLRSLAKFARFTSVVLFLTFGAENALAARSPIVIVPGLMGSQLWATVDVAGLKCNSPVTPKQLWLSIDGTLDGCIKELALQFDQATRTFSDASGVDVSVPGFGDTDTIECLDSSELACETFSDLLYFKTFVDYFVKRGYVRGRNIRAAPYDWRLAANSARLSTYFSHLRNLIEQTYTMNSNSPVTLVVHSMGGPMSLYFLNRVVTPAWRSQYIAAYVTLSGAWAGATRSLGALAAGVSPLGDGLGSYLREIERNVQSLYWLSPDPTIFGNQAQIVTPSQTYTAMDYQALYTGFLGYPVGWLKYQTTGTNDYSFPQVPTYCFYGSEVNTAETYRYSSNDPSTTPIATNGLGDGTVNKISLEVCLNWKTINGSTNSDFRSRAFPAVNHLGMVMNSGVLNLVAQIAGVSDSDLVNSAGGVHISIASLLCSIFVVIGAHLW